MDTTLLYTTFENKEVETFGKGKPDTTVEKVETAIKYPQYQERLRWVSNMKI